MTEAAKIEFRYDRIANECLSMDDTSLVRKCQHGDSDAMEQLILKYQNRIYNVILKICADPDDASELTQETFVKVIENIDKFQGKSRFYTWAFRIAVNLTLNYRKKNSKYDISSLDAEKEYEEAQTTQAMKEFLKDDNSPDPVEVAQNKELCDLTIKALLQLDEPQKAVVVLRDIEGMNYAQIAEVLDIELGTVRSRLSRARGRLREILEAGCNDRRNENRRIAE
ncbi:MAG: sigma-70 family RNA polymerase sigma factor [Sedimentisphaerales bacterium]|nr:sigma-70 family RNA polymerase sigma factor [Sedimentisphaerales bacterium]